MYAKFFEELAFLVPHFYACAYQGARKVSFSKNIENVLNGLSPAVFPRN